MANKGLILAIAAKFDDRELKKAASQLDDFGQKASLVVGAAFAAAGYAAFQFGKDAVLAAEGVQVANQRLGQIAESMGLFGSQTADVTDRLIKYAEANEMALGTDAELIKATQAKLLTFAELGATADEAGGAFDRATLAAIDLAAAGFGSAESNATQLGKALQDPIKGLTALTRSGVTFTEEQKKLITSLVESGDILSAQDLILSAIETQVGGTAAATATASEKMSLAFGNLSEQVGAALLPAVESLIPILEDLLPVLGEQLVQAVNSVPWEKVVTDLANFAGWVIQNIDGLTRIAQVVGIAAAVFGTLTIAIKTAEIAMAIMKVTNAVLASTFGATAAGAAAATTAMKLFKAALITTGIGAIVVALGYVAEGFINAADKGENLNNTDLSGMVGELNGVESAAWGAANALGYVQIPEGGLIPASPTGASTKPQNPKPGEVYTWYNLDPKTNQAVWWTQTWTGSTWSKPEKMTYTPSGGGGGGGGGAKKVNPVDEFFKDLNAQIAKQKAAIKLADLGLSQPLIEKILGSGSDWQQIFDYIVKGGSAAADEMQKLFNKTEDGLAAAKEAAEQLAAQTQAIIDSTMERYDRLLAAYEENQAAIKALNSEVQNLYDSYKETFAVADQFGEAEQAVLDLTKGLRDLIAAQDNTFMTEKQKKKVQTYLSAVESDMRAVAQQRDDLASRLDEAKSVFKDYFDSIVGSVDITKFKGKSESIIKQLRKQVEAQAKFQEDIKKLRSSGLSQQALEQIQKAGVEAGGATAQALLTGGQGAIDEVNSLYAQLGDIATSATEAELGPMFGAGVDLSNGLIAGLEAQSNQLKIVAEGLALDFADSFENILNKNIRRLARPDAGAWAQYAQDLAAAQQALAATLAPGQQVQYRPGDIVNGIQMPSMPVSDPTTRGQITINVTAGMGTNGGEVGRQIVDEIKKYERRNGAVFVPAVM